MKYESLSQASKNYIARYIRGTDKTPEDAMKEVIVMEVIKEYESNREIL